MEKSIVIKQKTVDNLFIGNAFEMIQRLASLARALGRHSQSSELKDFLEKRTKAGKHDL